MSYKLTDAASLNGKTACVMAILYRDSSNEWSLRIVGEGAMGRTAADNVDELQKILTVNPLPPPGMMAMQPGMIQPGMAIQPGMVQPGMIQPGMLQPGMIQPGMIQPGMAQPGMAQPGMAIQPGMMQPGMTPEMMQQQQMMQMQQQPMMQQPQQAAAVRVQARVVQP